VLLISVDGLAPRYLEDLLAKGEAPTFQRLIDEGASTLNARTEARITVTIPNHTSMISGRPAVAVPGMAADTHHGVVYNDDPEDTSILHGENPDLAYLTSIFDEVHDRGGYTALFTGKDKFAVFDRSYAAPHARPDTIGDDDGDDKIENFSVVFDASLLVPELLAALDTGLGAKPDVASFAMFHFRDTDALGHASGWDSPEYVGALQRVDGLIGDILDHITASTVFANMTVIVTTDHSGLDLTHDDIADERIYRIPLFVWGQSVPSGIDLYEGGLGTRVDPGAEAPVDGVPDQPIRNGDVANFALWLLGLEPIEGALHNGMQLGMPVCP
jgi:predicted AlkP superfamily pyrophosphatase or phosphodiesterase